MSQNALDISCRCLLRCKVGTISEAFKIYARSLAETTRRLLRPFQGGRNALMADASIAWLPRVSSKWPRSGVNSCRDTDGRTAAAEGNARHIIKQKIRHLYIFRPLSLRQEIHMQTSNVMPFRLTRFLYKDRGKQLVCFVHARFIGSVCGVVEWCCI